MLAVSPARRPAVNEEVFNLEIRKFLKQFGVAAQRELERSAAIPGTGAGLPVRATLEIGGRQVLDLAAELRLE